MENENNPNVNFSDENTPFTAPDEINESAASTAEDFVPFTNSPETTAKVDEANQPETTAQKEDVNPSQSACETSLQNSQEVIEKINGLASLIDGHFLAIRNLLKFNKDKDANVSKLTGALQTYRDGLENKYFKSIALDLIGYREDCKKSVREFKDRGLTVAEAKKYLNYLVYDYEDLLENLNVRVEDGKVYFNNKPIDAGFDKKIKTCEIGEFVLPAEPVLENKTLDGVTEYLKKVENYITEVLKCNAGLDNILKVYIDNSLLYEEGVHQLMVYPVIGCIAKLYLSTKAQTEEKIAALTEENATQSFIDCSNVLIDALEELLLKCTVTIDGEVSDTYDPLKHRLLKIIYTDNPEENGKIVERYTDCYMMETKVIYPQKADVMKYQEKK